ncbi:MAG: hypothetical protein US50_C0050G0004 [Candidatus Nomurabacteria bacterium GW2011_GWB1_37_5]|uniref:Uncharacterized protein n=1 Tax=Candidatus Nomurabacteria bacterium GW2011_GWB1_37_5 TaxID=1618742 RepID=A0A0G0K174_9BACT|nr:MAG: hypothetical protein US50_C0050G0004 [Candidatus Nomurabacteria bacterium GW2011_GWB1_37_5]
MHFLKCFPRHGKALEGTSTNLIPKDTPEESDNPSRIKQQNPRSTCLGFYFFNILINSSEKFFIDLSS